MSEISPRDLGRLEEKTAHLESELEEIKADVKAIRTTMDQAKGGWKTVAMAAGIAGTLGALLGKFGFFIKP